MVLIHIASLLVDNNHASGKYPRCSERPWPGGGHCNCISMLWLLIAIIPRVYATHIDMPHCQVCTTHGLFEGAFHNMYSDSLNCLADIFNLDPDSPACAAKITTPAVQTACCQDTPPTIAPTVPPTEPTVPAPCNPCNPDNDPLDGWGLQEPDEKELPIFSPANDADPQTCGEVYDYNAGTDECAWASGFLPIVEYSSGCCNCGSLCRDYEINITCNAPGGFCNEVLAAVKYTKGDTVGIENDGVKPKFCCNDYYIEPTNFSNLANYNELVIENQKRSCSGSKQTDKCGNIVATRNSHMYAGGGTACIESKSCLECIEHFQILCGPGYTWDDSSQHCEWKTDITHALAYGQGHDILGSHGDESCIVLDQNGYALSKAGMSENCSITSAPSNRCYSAFHNVDVGGGPSSMVGQEEIENWGLGWEGHTQAPSDTYVSPPTRNPVPAPPPTVERPATPPPTSNRDRYTDQTNMYYDNFKKTLMHGFCCSRFFEEGIVGGAKEIFEEGKEFMPGTDTDTHVINMGIADGSLSPGHRRLSYNAEGEIPAFSDLFFGGHNACGHNPPVDTKCGRVVDPHGLSLQHVDMTEYLGAAQCGDSGGINECHNRVRDSIETFSDKIIPGSDIQDWTNEDTTFLNYDYILANYYGGDSLDMSLSAHYKAYIKGCFNAGGCGFHSDCTSLCHPAAKVVYEYSEGCDNCTYVGCENTPGCDSITCVAHQHKTTECNRETVESWEPVPSLCTSTSTYRPPHAEVLDSGGDRPDICRDDGKCLNHDGDYFLSKLFTENSDVHENCMCSVDNRQKADEEHEPCFMCLQANVIACADQYSYQTNADKCVPGGICSNFHDECHVQPEDQLYADPIPCLAVSGHQFKLNEDPVVTDREVCKDTKYTVPRACVWDQKTKKCKAGIYFGAYNASFDAVCERVSLDMYSTTSTQAEWKCESTVWDEKRPCQFDERVAYPVQCTRDYTENVINCEPSRRQIPWSPDPDDICDVLKGRKNASRMGKSYDKKQTMLALGHLCDWTPESLLDKLVDWLSDLSPMEIVAFAFLATPVVGTLVCMANSIFRWNQGCLKKCCHHKSNKSTWKRTQVADTIKSNVIIVDPSQDTKKR